IFPDDFYRELRENLPEAQQMSTVESLGRVSIGVNPGRVVMPLTRENCARLGGRKGQFWERLGSWLMGDTFGQMMIRKFGPWLEQRFPDLSQARLQDEALIQREETHFGLGPHTDAGSKVLAFHFYLPADASTSQLGTSIYAPKDPAFVCPGGPYYPHADFRRM